MSEHLPARVRQTGPLVYCITNFVTMDWVARGLLAAGARPIMARDAAEAEQVAAAADALVLNLGTWSPDVQAAMLAAGRVAGERGIPIVLDPVGAGGIETRTEAALEILNKLAVSAIRGNAGEIAALTGRTGLVRGVDGEVEALRATIAATREAARRFGCIVAATGEVDVVSDGTHTLLVRSGNRLMSQVPGAGCLSAALLAAALTTGAPNRMHVAQALLWAGAAGEAAAEEAMGPGSFATAFLDALGLMEELPEGRIAPPLEDRLGAYVIVSGQTPADVIEQVLAAGVRTIQFREKRLPMQAQVQAALAVRELCDKHGALLLINDRVDLALAVGADGVHLGQDDMPVFAARKLMGPQAVIGATCETEAEARIATEQGADYIGTGPVYATPSKADAGDPYGPDVVRRVSGATHIPVIGIGGIGPGNAAPVIAAGGVGVAVISSVVGAPDPGDAARRLLAEVLAAKGDR